MKKIYIGLFKLYFIEINIQKLKQLDAKNTPCSSKSILVNDPTHSLKVENIVQNKKRYVAKKIMKTAYQQRIPKKTQERKMKSKI